MPFVPRSPLAFVSLAAAAVTLTSTAHAERATESGTSPASEPSLVSPTLSKDESAVAARLARFGLDRPHREGSLLVKFRKGTLASASAAAAGARVTRVLRSSGTSVLRFVEESLSGKALLRKAEELMASGSVEWVEANAIVRAIGTGAGAVTARPSAHVTPNDPDFAKLWGLENTGLDGGAPGVDSGVTRAWGTTTGSRDVLVAIIDTGLDRAHPDIAANAWRNPGETGRDAQGRDKGANGVDDDRNGYVDDVHGWDFANDDNDPMDDNEHGTHVAGTIGAVGDDGKGVAGMNWKVSLVGLKFLGADGSGELDAAVAAIEYATAIGAPITNNSWGGGGWSKTLEAAIREANARGSLFVAAAGNEANDNDASSSYPAGYPIANVLSVAAIDSRGRVAGFSNYGKRTVHLGAPGVDIYSTAPGGGYATLDGTSMATPHVAGAAALIKAAFPTATAAQIRARLLWNAVALPSLVGKTSTGGRLDAAKALESDTVAPGRVADVRIAEAGITSVVVEWKATGDDGATGRAAAYEVRTGRRGVRTEGGWVRSKRVSFHYLSTLESGTLRAEVTGLPLSAAGHVTVRAVDNVGNVGAFSESVPFATKALRTIKIDRADSLSGAKVTGTWGLQAVGGGKAYSDSPAGDYDANEASSITFAPVAIEGREGLLSFRQKVSLEEGYDNGRVEISTDGGSSWRLAASVTGETGAWEEKTVDLSPWLSAGANRVTLRLRLESDYSEQRDGWLVDDVTWRAPAQ